MIERGEFIFSPLNYRCGGIMPYKENHYHEWKAEGQCVSCSEPAVKGVKCEKHRISGSDNKRRFERKCRVEVLDFYGGRCVCCGEDDYKYLTMDHKNNDGAEHRRELNGGGSSIIRWIRRTGYPDTMQILCWNCNAAKHFYGGCTKHG